MSSPIQLSPSGCQVHLGVHRPQLKRAGGYTIDVHHIHPLSRGGTDTAANRIRCCPTGHVAIHELLRQWVKADGQPSWAIRRHYHPSERKYARLGFEAIMKGTT